MMTASQKPTPSDSTILIVDDNLEILAVIHEYLQDSGFEIMVATDGELAIQRAERGQPDIILMDVLMPGIDGFEICRRLKASQSTKDIPVIFLTALGGTEDRVKGFESGGVDYILKPLQMEEVLARVTTQLQIRKLTKELENTCNEQEQRIKERTAELARANEELKAQIAERKQNEALINLRWELMQYADSHGLGELFAKALDGVEALTQSKISFYHFVNPDQKTLLLKAWSTATVTKFCTAEAKGEHYALDQAGVWVDCIHQRRPVIHNDYESLPHKKGMPDGHVQVTRELVVPIFRGEKIVAIQGVGNKSSDYTHSDVKTATYCADVVWEITERKRAEAKLLESEERSPPVSE